MKMSFMVGFLPYFSAFQLNLESTLNFDISVCPFLRNYKAWGGGKNILGTPETRTNVPFWGTSYFSLRCCFEGIYLFISSQFFHFFLWVPTWASLLRIAGHCRLHSVHEPFLMLSTKALEHVKQRCAGAWKPAFLAPICTCNTLLRISALSTKLPIHLSPHGQPHTQGRCPHTLI